MVKYFKRDAGKWQLLGTHHPKFRKNGLAETAFYPRVDKGTCKLTGRYPGDSKYDASSTKMVFDCKSGAHKS